MRIKCSPFHQLTYSHGNILSELHHRKKRTQIKARKHKLNFDEHLHSVKRERIEAEYETKKIVEGSNKRGKVPMTIMEKIWHQTKLVC